MDGNYDTGPGHHSQPRTPFDTPRRSFAEQTDTTQEGVVRDLRIPPDISPEFLAAIQEFVNLTHWANRECEGLERTSHSVSCSSAAGPSGTNMSPSPQSELFSQYSIHHDSPEPSGRIPVPTIPASKTRGLELPPLSVAPLRGIRPFRVSTHSLGNTIWATTASCEDLSDPPEPGGRTRCSIHSQEPDR